MSKILLRIKLFLNYLYILTMYKFTKHEFDKNNRNIYIHLTNPNYPRYSYLLIKILSISGFNIRLICNYKILSTMLDYHNKIYEIDNLKLSFLGEIENADLVIIDNNENKVYNYNVKTYIVNCDYYTER